jgi:hypothetical protein
VCALISSGTETSASDVQINTAEFSIKHTPLWVRGIYLYISISIYLRMKKKKKRGTRERGEREILCLYSLWNFCECYLFIIYFTSFGNVNMFPMPIKLLN